MKSEVNTCCKNTSLKFPRLMKSKRSGAIFLVSSSRFNSFSGVVVNGATSVGLGVGHANGSFLGFDQLEDYNGTVTLSND